MNLKDLTGKKVRIGIKNGMTVADFCAKYECSPEEFRARLRKLFTVKNAADEILRQIKKSHHESPKRKEEVAPEQPVTVAEVADSVPLKEPGLSELRDEEELLSQRVIELERRHGSLSAHRYELRTKFQQLRDEMAAFKRQYEVLAQDAERVAERDAEIVEAMNEIAEIYHKERATLGAIRKKIQELRKVVISVSQNGEIALFDGEIDEEFDDSGHEDLYEILRERKEAEEFRPKDLRVVARLIKIVERLTVQVDIIYENDEVELGFEIFRKE